MATANRTSIVLFEAASPAEHAMVHMKDGDRFLIAIADAARACQGLNQFEKFAEQFRELVDTTISQWIDKYRDRIQSAHLTVRDRDILFVVVQKECEFDQTLSDALTDLDISVANGQDFELIDLEVLALPRVAESSCTAFLASGRSFTYAK